MAIGTNDYSQGRLAVALSAFGFMADQYDVHIVNLVRPYLAVDYGPMTPTEDALVTGAVLLGSFFGMIGFGAAADHLGRRCLFIITASLVAIASLGCACAHPFLGMSTYTVLIMWRFILGLGIGGEYPLAAAVTAESTDTASSTQALAIIFAGMCSGSLLGPSVMMCMEGPLGFAGTKLWRYAFGFGATLALVVAVLRFATLKETRAWEAASAGFRYPGRLEPQHVSLRQSIAEKTSALSAMKYSVIGTVGTWMIYDVVTYGTGMYSTTIFPAQPGQSSSLVVLKIALMTSPGYLIAIILPRFFHMKSLQVMGLLGMVFLFSWMAFLHDKVNHTGAPMVTIYAFQRCVDVMGPGIATFVIPAQIYPTRIRASGMGISASAGKFGAVIGTGIFPYLNNAAGLKAVFVFMAATSAVAAVWTHLFTPLYDSTLLEEIEQLDSSVGLQDQASKAEALLFPKLKAENLPLVCDPPHGQANYSNEEGKVK